MIEVKTQTSVPEKLWHNFVTDHIWKIDSHFDPLTYKMM